MKINFIFIFSFYSHELRTPMAAVIGLLDILMYDNCLTNEQFATITQIRKCSTALLRLLNNILDLSKVRLIKVYITPHNQFLKASCSYLYNYHLCSTDHFYICCNSTRLSSDMGTDILCTLLSSTDSCQTLLRHVLNI